MATVIHLPIARPAEPTIATLSTIGNVPYDITINGNGFILATFQDSPLGRSTAQYRKDQFDAAREAGEQSLDFWWLRSQASFHGGAGQLYYEPPGGDEAITRIRFDASRNVDVWTPGRVTRLPDATQVISSGSDVGGLVGARQGTNNYALVAFGTALQSRKITDAGVSTTENYTWGGASTIQSLATNGLTYYAAASSGIYAGPVDNSGSGAKLWDAGTLVCVGWVKQRLMAGINNSVYELVGGAPPTLPTAIYVHPNTDWRWTAFSESPTGILAAGYSGDESAIVEFTLETDGGAPTLAAGTVAARLPLGERVHSMRSYAGTVLVLGTSKGVRVGGFTDSGALRYGPLSVETTTPVYALTARGDFVYATASAYQDGESCLIRLDLGTTVDDAGRHAYASDLLSGQTGTCSGVTVVNGRLSFAVNGYGLLLEGVGPGTSGTAWIRTSRIRYSTVEPKLFKSARIRGDFPDDINVYAVTPVAAEDQVLDLDSSSGDPDEFGLPAGGYEWIQLRIEMLGSADHELRSYQIKALPGTKRQRLIQAGIRCGDSIRHRHGGAIGYRGYGWHLLQILEGLEETGDVVIYESQLPYAPESRLCVIDRVVFEQTVPATQVSGISGVATVTLRTVD